jgi:serine/threonine protein kinase
LGIADPSTQISRIEKLTQEGKPALVGKSLIPQEDVAWLFFSEVATHLAVESKRHSTIVTLAGVFMGSEEPVDTPYTILTEFVEGETLESLLKRWRTTPRASKAPVYRSDTSLEGDRMKIAKIILEMITGLHTIHASGVIHGDLKPANIFLTNDQHVRIGDFGSAQFSGAVKHPVKPTTTMVYSPPERNRSQEFDVFSFGIILWEILMTVPWTYATTAIVAPYNSPAELVRAAACGSPEGDIPETNKFPTVLGRMISRCLNIVAEKRPTFESLLAEVKPRVSPERGPSRYSGFAGEVSRAEYEELQNWLPGL